MDTATIIGKLDCGDTEYILYDRSIQIELEHYSNTDRLRCCWIDNVNGNLTVNVITTASVSGQSEQQRLHFGHTFLQSLAAPTL